MADQKKTPIHKHSHPAYSWIALIVSVVMILGVAGWYYLTISDGYNDDLVYTVECLTGPPKQTSATSTTEPVDITTETSSIDAELGNITEADLADTQLDNTILGIQ